MKSRKSIISIAFALALAVFVTGCSFSFSTAKIEDAIMTNSIDAEGKPGEEVVSFAADAAMLYTSAKLLSAPDNTQIRIVWTYVTGNQAMGEVIVDSGDVSDQYISSNYEPTGLLPEGDYQVQYFIDEREEPDAIVKFVVVAAAMKADDTTAAYLEDTHMTSNVDENGMPVDSISTVPATGTWYISSVLRNTQADTILTYVWYDTNGDVLDEYNLDPQGATDVYVFGSIVLASVAPSGQYRVEIYIDGSSSTAASVDFTVD